MNEIYTYFLFVHSYVFLCKTLIKTITLLINPRYRHNTPKALEKVLLKKRSHLKVVQGFLYSLNLKLVQRLVGFFFFGLHNMRRQKPFPFKNPHLGMVNSQLEVLHLFDNKFVDKKYHNVREESYFSIVAFFVFDMCYKSFLNPLKCR